jgi:hypothetical protein
MVSDCPNKENNMGTWSEELAGVEAVDQIQEVVELAGNLQSSLFATKDSLEEAYSYTFGIINTLPPEHRAGVITGVQVLVNTIAEEIKRKAEGRV